MTVTIGYDKALYVLPFDHQATFSKNMFGWQGPLRPEQTAEIAAANQLIFAGFEAAVARCVPKDRAGILEGEQFSAASLLATGLFTGTQPNHSGGQRRRIAAACGRSSWPAFAWRSPGRGR
jgi:hypothetical protein